MSASSSRNSSPIFKSHSLCTLHWEAPLERLLTPAPLTGSVPGAELRPSTRHPCAPCSCQAGGVWPVTAQRSLLHTNSYKKETLEEKNAEIKAAPPALEARFVVQPPRPTPLLLLSYWHSALRAPNTFSLTAKRKPYWRS